MNQDNFLSILMQKVIDFRRKSGIIQACKANCRNIQEENQLQGYCVKCKEKKEMKGAKAITMKNGKPASQGTCPTCGTKMFKIGKAQLKSLQCINKAGYKLYPALFFILLKTDQLKFKLVISQGTGYFKVGASHIHRDIHSDITKLPETTISSISSEKR